MLKFKILILFLTFLFKSNNLKFIKGKFKILRILKEKNNKTITKNLNYNPVYKNITNNNEDNNHGDTDNNNNNQNKNGNENMKWIILGIVLVILIIIGILIFIFIKKKRNSEELVEDEYDL